jgi:hypothetical protein
MPMCDPSRRVALLAGLCAGVAGCGSAGCSSHGGNMQQPPPPGDGTGGSGSDGGIVVVDDGGVPDAPMAPPPIDGGPVPVGTLRVDPMNHRYFTAGHGAIYLTGSHTWANFKDRAKNDPPTPFNYDAYLDFLVAHRHNFFRLWTWEQPHSADDDDRAHPFFFSPFPWLRTGPGTASDGKPAFDLTKVNSDYYTRLQQRVTKARDRGLYVAVMLFDGWDLSNAPNTAGGFPLATGNNINGVKIAPADYFALPGGQIIAQQQDYIRNVVTALDDLDNVVYEVANETLAGAVQWQAAVIQFVRDTEQSMPKKHPVGMTSTFPGSDSDLMNSTADWISPNDKNALGDGRKVVLNDTDHSFGWTELQSAGTTGQRAWAWETLCRGAQPMFMDPYLEPWLVPHDPFPVRNNPQNGSVDPQWETIRAALGWTQLYASKLDLERAVPSSNLCSTGFCLAEPGHRYLVYQPPTPSSTSFTVNVVAGMYRFEWFDPAAGALVTSGTTNLPTEQHTFTLPKGLASTDAVLLLLLQ